MAVTLTERPLRFIYENLAYGHFIELALIKIQLYYIIYYYTGNIIMNTKLETFQSEFPFFYVWLFFVHYSHYIRAKRFDANHLISHIQSKTMLFNGFSIFLTYYLFLKKKTSNIVEEALISRKTQLSRDALARALGGTDVHLPNTIPDLRGQLLQIIGPAIIFVH